MPMFPDLIMTTLNIEKYMIKRFLVYIWSSSNILLVSTLEKMVQEVPTHQARTCMHFFGVHHRVEGEISLPITLGKGPRTFSHEAQFLVIDAPV